LRTRLFNERHLDELTRNTQARVDEMQARYDQLARQMYMGDRSAATANELAALGPQLQSAKHSLAEYRNVQDAMKTPEGGPKRYLGLLDERGRAAVSIGNPDTATRNATFVPGTGQDLTRMTDSIERAEAMYYAARDANVSLAADVVAVTTWMGYDRPMSLGEAASAGPATGGAGDLVGFQEGMRASHQGAASVDTVIGHSYGSALAGAAAIEGHHLPVDNVVAVGSPGMLTEHATNLSLNPGAQVYAMRAEHDIIDLVPNRGWALGPDPTTAGFGAIELQADPGPPGPWYFLGESVDAHSSYWTPGNPALDNMGAVIAGVTPPHPAR
jgi:hypothetical protein